MKTLDSHSFEHTLSERLEAIAATVDRGDPGEFDPDAVRLVATDEEPPSDRRGLVLAVAAAAVLAVGGLVVVTGRDTEPAPADQPATPPPPVDPVADTVPAFRFETQTVRLDAAGVEVITPAGTFSPPAEVVVEGDPGMPEESTTLELTWFDGDVEQRINIYFASDGASWWADEIRTYNGTTPGQWIEPPATGRFFETPLGEAFTGDLELANLHITDMTLQAFVQPDVCDNPTGPVALVADFPTIDGWVGSGYGASFQVYDTTTCQPLAIVDYTLDYTIADPDIATVTDQPIPTTTTAPVDTIPIGSAEPPTPRRQFADIKSRADISFHNVGATTLHAVASDATGTVIGTHDVPITVTEQPADEPTDTLPPIATTTVAAADDRDIDIELLLAGVPLPDGFDPTAIPLEGANHYQTVVRITGAVACAWLDQWFTGQETKNQQLSDQAVAALATSHQWAALDDIADQGDWPDVIRQHADAVNGGDGIMTGAGPQPPTRNLANNALGCSI